MSEYFFGMNYSLLPVKDYLAVTELQDMCLSMKYQTTLKNRRVWHLILLNRVFVLLLLGWCRDLLWVF